MLKRIADNPLLRNILIFFSGNLIALSAAISVQFFLPKILTVENYGLYKSFVLYLSYTSLLHFGLKDGIYIALCQEGGFTSKKPFIYYSFLIIQQLIVFCLILVASFFFNFPVKLIIISLAIASFFFIINTYYDSLCQSQKNFKTVSVLKIIKEVSFLIFLVIVYIFFQNPDIGFILIAFLTSVILTFIIYTTLLRKQIKVKRINKKELQVIKPIYKRGFKLITGNFGHQINTNADKLFVNIFYSIEQFAFYSFGGMFFVLVNTFVNSISTVLLPFLFKEYQHNLEEKHKQLMRITSFFSVLLLVYLLAVFYLVKYFYANYLSSIPIIALFYIAMVYNIKINIVQNNYLKTLGLDKQYIRNNFSTLAVFIIVMLLLYLFKVEFIYFALCTSLIMYLRSKLNLIAINTRLQSKKNYFGEDLLIFILAGFVFFYAKYMF